jgi:HEAT repeat protein
VERSKITTYRLAYDLTGNRHEAVYAIGRIGTEKAKAALIEILGMNPKE